MEPTLGTHKASMFEAKDYINNMPDNVVTNIMDRLPIRDAVRTGILSKDWRYKWNMLSQLVFDRDFLEYVYTTNFESNFRLIISRLLLDIKGSITKFVLYVDEMAYSIKVEDISHWILFLSRKGIMDFTLEMQRNGTPLKLPAHFFSCLELKHLKLVCCCLDPPTSFHGFPNLLSLELWMVDFPSWKIGEFLTRCPVLETLNMGVLFRVHEVKPAEFAKLANLKILSLLMCYLGNTSSNSIFELVGVLPKLQHLHLDFRGCMLKNGDAKRLSATFPCLKTLKLSRIDLRKGIMLSCAFELISSFSNLHSLEISASDSGTVSKPGAKIDYNTTGLLQLQSVVYTFFKALENEVCLIKYLLACSPCLKKFVIHPHPNLNPDEQLKFAKKLLKLQLAYPLVDIELC